MANNRKIYCVTCSEKVDAVKITGNQAYRHRHDLKDLIFWQCPTCKNFVGCHPATEKTNDRPLGIIANKELRQARTHIHNILDPLWNPDKKKRKKIYSLISEHFGWKYHTAKIKSIQEAREVYRFIRKIEDILHCFDDYLKYIGAKKLETSNNNYEVERFKINDEICIVYRSKIHDYSCSYSYNHHLAETIYTAFKEQRIVNAMDEYKKSYQT